MFTKRTIMATMTGLVTLASTLMAQAPQQRPLSPAERQDLLYMREEEKLARDVYLAMLERWEVRIFENISQSEQRHMDALGGLIERYGLTDPVTDITPGVFTNPDLAALYDELVARGSASLAEALQVGAFIEDLDIVDLREAMLRSRHTDITQAYDDLESGSCNHLRAFVRQITNLGGTYTPEFLTLAEYEAILNGTEAGSGQRKANAERAACDGACRRQLCGQGRGCARKARK
ncbi:MAG: DUF2202 domain-containing protein [Phycisphaerales bacterium]|nr:DUF2202 domain-containing protein [Phycisphaerales bacterium]